MATVAPITARASANAHSWLRRAIATLLMPSVPAPAPSPLEASIADLRVLLRRVEHARRDRAGWDRRFLSQTVRRAVTKPLEELQLDGETDRLRHGAVFVLASIADAGFALDKTDAEGALEDAAIMLRAAIAEAENALRA